MNEKAVIDQAISPRASETSMSRGVSHSRQARRPFLSVAVSLASLLKCQRRNMADARPSHRRRLATRMTSPRNRATNPRTNGKIWVWVSARQDSANTAIRSKARS